VLGKREVCGYFWLLQALDLNVWQQNGGLYMTKEGMRPLTTERSYSKRL